MSIKGLKDLLEKFRNGEIADDAAFESELNKALPDTWVPKTTFNELNDKHKLAEKQSKELSDQLATLKNKAGLADEYKTKIDELTAAQKTEKENFDKQLAELKNGYALDDALRGAKARNVKALKGMLDMSKITYDGDKVLGLDDQIKALKESDAYLFEEEETPADTNPPQLKPSFGSGLTKGDPNNGGNHFSKLEAQMRHAAGLM